MKIPEEQFYEIAGREVAENDVRLGLWTKAFSESPGDEQQAKALYIKYRVAQLSVEYKEAQAPPRQESGRKEPQRYPYPFSRVMVGIGFASVILLVVYVVQKPGHVDIAGYRVDGFSFVEKNEQGYDEYTHDGSGIRFVHLPGGEFEMGSPDTEEGRLSKEGPVHTVTLSPFLIAKYEVTQAEYKSVMVGSTAGLGPTPSRNYGRRRFGFPQRPVEQVSWDDLKEPDGFLARTGLSLPSEAQWEYAWRAGTTGDFAGNGNLDDMGWYDENSRGSHHPVGRKQANQFGLQDMHGNVWEWCEDVYNEDFYSTAEAYGPDPVSTSGSVNRVFRGGSFVNLAQDARSAYRLDSDPPFRGYLIGFRPARPLP